MGKRALSHYGGTRAPPGGPPIASFEIAMRLRHMLAAVAIAGALAASGDEPKVPEFRAKVKSYTDLVDRLDKDLGRLPDRAGPEQINAHKRALAAAVKQARAAAKPGEIFVASEQPVFKSILKTETRGKEGAPARKTIAEDNPKTPDPGHKTPPVTLAVNATYPDGAPRSTTPPTILLRLPKLPENVEFRFVGKALVLYDPRANLIVDFIPNAL